MPTSAPYCITVLTRYHGPTDSRGARISARLVGGLRPGEDPRRIIRPWDYERDTHDLYAFTALACVQKAYPDSTPVCVGYGDMGADYVYLFRLQ